MGTVTTSIPTFNGTSQFAGDLQTVITNEVARASAPITAMQTQQTILQNQAQAISSIDGDFTSLQTSIQGIQTALSSSSMSVAVSNPNIVSASVGQGASPGNYSILVSDLGAFSTTLEQLPGQARRRVPPIPTSSQSARRLSTSPPPITPPPAWRRPSIPNWAMWFRRRWSMSGPNSSPDYRLSLQSANLTSDAIDLTDNGTSVAAIQSPGAPAQYEINNSGNVVSSDSRTVDVAAGVTFNLLGTSTSPVTIDVTQSASAVSNAVSAFVSAYNTAQTDLSQQRGQNGGPLQGTQVINELQQVLHGLVTYSPMSGGAVNGWADLGVAFNTDSDNDGTLTFDPTALQNAELSSPNAVTAFLGAAPGDSFTTGDASATGSGFLLSATNALTSLEDPSSGLLKTTESDYQSQLSSLSTQMTTRQAQVEQLKEELTNQMNTADAMINSLEQQYTNLSGILQAQQIDDQAFHG